MASSNKWLEWYNTPEGQEYYNKHLATIPGINADEQTIKNAYYQWVDTTYKAQDSITNTFSNVSNIVKIAAIFAIIFFIFKFKRILK